MKYSGIDLHSTNSVVVVSDEADRVRFASRIRVPPRAKPTGPALGGLSITFMR
jgi:hypothetical protein